MADTAEDAPTVRPTKSSPLCGMFLGCDCDCDCDCDCGDGLIPELDGENSMSGEMADIKPDRVVLPKVSGLESAAVEGVLGTGLSNRL